MTQTISIGIQYNYYQILFGFYDTKTNQPILFQEDRINKTIPSCLSIQFTQNKIIINYGNKAQISDGTIVWGMKETKDNSFETKSKQREIIDKIKISNFNLKQIFQLFELYEINENELFSPFEITTLIINNLMNIIKRKYQSVTIGKVCFSVSMDYILNKKEDLTMACVYSGIKKENIEFINPIQSTILAYKKLAKNKLKMGNKIIVINFTKRSFDVYCCEIVGNDEKCQSLDDFVKILEHGNEPRLSGKKFDVILTEMISSKINDSLIREKQQPIDFDMFWSIDQHADKETMNESIGAIGFLRGEIERSKKSFWKEGKVNVSPQNFVPTMRKMTNSSATVTMSDFEKILTKEKEMERMLNCVKETMMKVKFTQKNVNHCLLIGETSKIPIVRSTLKHFFHRDVILPEVNIFNPEMCEVDGAILRSYHTRNTIDTSSPTLPTPVYSRIGTEQYQKVFEQGIQLPATSIFSVHLDKIYEKKYFLEIANTLNDMKEIQPIETELMINDKLNKNDFKIKLMINEFGSIKVGIINENLNGKEKEKKKEIEMKYIGNIGMMKTDREKDIENLRLFIECIK